MENQKEALKKIYQSIVDKAIDYCYELEDGDNINTDFEINGQVFWIEAQYHCVEIENLPHEAPSLSKTKERLSFVDITFYDNENNQMRINEDGTLSVIDIDLFSFLGELFKPQ